jgi:Fe-S cluster assembly protein SufD
MAVTAEDAATADSPVTVVQPAEGGPPWLAVRRAAAAEAFTALAMPSSIHDEDWRRTDIAKLDLESFESMPSAVDTSAEFIATLRAFRDACDPQAGFLATTRAGLVASEQLESLAAQGITVSSIDDAAHRHPELVEQALAALRCDEEKLLALWLAKLHGGCFIHVPAGVQAAVPVVIAHGTSGVAVSIFPASLVMVDDNASLTVIEVYSSPAGDTGMLSDAATSMVLGRNARLDYCTVQRWGDGVWHFATQRAHVGHDARLRFFGAALGARLQKVYWEAILDGRGADAGINGLAFGRGDRHIDTQSMQSHRAPQTRSDLLLKVAVRDRARSVYSGMIEVDRTAQQADGYVQNRNLILSQGARATGVPRLEIRANDVKCGHGATVGHIDEDHRFYLESRGIPTEIAEQIIVRGFFDDALAHAPHAGFVEMVNGLLDAEVGGHSAAGTAGEAF